MDILMPSFLDVSDSIRFINKLDKIKPYEDVVFDYSTGRRFRPFGMLLVASKIREFCKRNQDFNISDVNYESHTYPAHMGYFQCINECFGKKPGEAVGSSSYVPITYLSIDELRKGAGCRFLEIPDYIEEVFHPLAAVLSRRNTSVQHIFLYAIRELVRNVEEHSKADGIWFAGQYWPSYNLVEIALLDEGVGLYNSLTESGFYTFNDEEEAVLMALQPGISKAFKGKQRRPGVYENSGYGLYMTSRLCGYGGSFTICSSGKSVTMRRDNVTTCDASFSGTAIQMQLRIDEIAKIPNLLTEISKKGKELTTKYGGFKEPSKSSLLNSLRY